MSYFNKNILTDIGHSHVRRSKSVSAFARHKNPYESLGLWRFIALPINERVIEEIYYHMQANLH